LKFSKAFPENDLTKDIDQNLQKESNNL